MKKIYKSIFFTIFAGLSVASCDNYEAPAITSDPAVSIVGRDTDFPASASTGTIQFKADGPVTVTTSNEWLSATVEGDEIKVSCTQNNSLESRSGIITVKCGEKTTEISIIQEGVIFQLGEGADNIKFTAGKATQTIVAKSNVPVEIASEYEWLSGDFNDGVITINVDDNISLDDRIGSLKLICGNTENELSVTQSGISYPIFDRTEWYPTDAKTRYNLDYPFDMDIEYSSTDPEMLTYEWDKEKKKLYINTEKNETGHLRTGSFTYTIGPKSGSMWVHQCDFTKDLVSEEYNLYFIDPSDGKLYYMPAIVKWPLFKMIELPTLGLEFVINYSTTDHTISFTGGVDCGKWNNYNIFTSFGFYMDGETYTTWSTEPSMKTLPIYEFYEDDNVGCTIAAFEDAGTYEYEVDELQFAAFTSDTPSASSRVGVLVRMLAPTLVRVHEVAGEEAPAAAPAKAPKFNKAALRDAKPAAPVLSKNDDMILCR